MSTHLFSSHVSMALLKFPKLRNLAPPPRPPSVFLHRRGSLEPSCPLQLSVAIAHAISSSFLLRFSPSSSPVFRLLNLLQSSFIVFPSLHFRRPPSSLSLLAMESDCYQCRLQLVVELEEV
ncbi:hypothetical protein ACLOJK_011623 [Asimina triloba]